MKKFLLAIFINLFFLGIIFLGGEFWAKNNWQKTTKTVSAVGIPIFQNDEILSFSHKPNSVVENGYGTPTPKIFIDQFGFRNGKLVRENFGNKKGVLLLGDSFTFGTGLKYEETFAGVLSKNLGTDLEVFNAGIIGQTVDQYYLHLKKNYEKIKPQKIIVNIFVANDITEFRRHKLFFKDNDLAKVLDLKILVDEKNKLISRENNLPKSYFWNFLKTRWQILLNKLSIQKENSEPTLTWPVFLAESSPNFDSRIPDFWEKFEQSLILIKNFCTKKNLDLEIIIHPMDVQVDKNYWQKYAIFHFDEEAFLSARPQKKILEVCAEQNLKCLDLLPIFRENKNRQNLYWQNEDPHYNKFGHKVVAEEILKKIL